MRRWIPVAAICVLLLAACGENYEANPPLGEQVVELSETIWIEHPVTGVPAPCVFFAIGDDDDSAGFGYAGLTCDWGYDTYEEGND